MFFNITKVLELLIIENVSCKAGICKNFTLEINYYSKLCIELLKHFIIRHCCCFRARPIKKLCEFEGKTLPEDYKSDCYQNVDETDYACKEKYRIMVSIPYVNPQKQQQLLLILLIKLGQKHINFALQ